MYNFKNKYNTATQIKNKLILKKHKIFKYYEYYKQLTKNNF